MNDLASILLLAGLAFLCFAVIGLIRSMRSRSRFRRIDFMTQNEQEFFGGLTSAVPRGWQVFPQVAMSALIEPAVRRRSKQWTGLFSEISTQRIDFVICDREFQPCVVVELDDQSHAGKGKEDRRRDERLAAAGIPTIRYPSKSKPSAAEISLQLAAIRVPQPF